MDKFSHDLTIALEETSFLDGANVGRWGQRRRTRSTGNLPCAPQPTEDSSSSPTDAANNVLLISNVDGLAASKLIPSDSDDKGEALRLPFNSVDRSVPLGTIESDSLNETFSPARFFKPNTRRKRKFKRTSIECEPSCMQFDYLEQSSYSGTVRKRLIRPEVQRTIFFSGKRKRSLFDRYHHDAEKAKLHSSSMPKQNFMRPLNNYFEDYRNTPPTLTPTNTTQLQCDRILPLTKGLVSRIERMSKLEKMVYSNCANINNLTVGNDVNEKTKNKSVAELQSEKNANFCVNKQKLSRKKRNRLAHEKLKRQMQFDEQISMECEEFYEYSTSSSLSSSESDGEQTNDTDREGDDELTDWPGNESIICDAKFDLKRKLTKKLQLSFLKTEENTSIAEDDKCMGFGSQQEEIKDTLETKFMASDPIAINQNTLLKSNHMNSSVSVPLKQIESEMSGETSNSFFSSPPCQPIEVRELRAGCRRIKCERPGFSIKTSVNERLARFLQDAGQLQIRLPDIEIYEHESLINLSKLYSLHMSLDKGCVVLTKTSNTTQSVNIDQHSFQAQMFFSDYKRRCYDSKGNCIPKK